MLFSRKSQKRQKFYHFPHNSKFYRIESDCFYQTLKRQLSFCRSIFVKEVTGIASCTATLINRKAKNCKKLCFFLISELKFSQKCHFVFLHQDLQWQFFTSWNILDKEVKDNALCLGILIGHQFQKWRLVMWFLDVQKEIFSKITKIVSYIKVSTSRFLLKTDF